MLSEYEQNLIKETAESPVPGRRRKWSLFKQGGGAPSKSPESRAAHQSPARKPMIGVGGFRQVSSVARFLCLQSDPSLFSSVFDVKYYVSWSIHITEMQEICGLGC